jgi:uncharacterized protein YndB with AHSA1/START domain
MKWAFIVVAALFGLIGLIAIVGAMLPRDHVATVTAIIPAAPDQVWAALTDVGAHPSWRADVQRVEILTQPPAPLSWKEHGKQGTMTMAVEVFEPPRRLVARIADKNLPFGGTWEYALVPEGTDGGGTRLTITERGFVSNPIFRFISHFVMGHYATLEAYVRALGRKFGGEVVPTRA